jgi:glycerophosphoryl diester phosphodiesterase
LTVPTLDEVCSLFPAAHLNIEIKPDDETLPGVLDGVLRRTGAEDRVLVAAFPDRVLRRFRSLRPEVPTALGQQEAGELLERFREGTLADHSPPGTALQIPERYGDNAPFSPAILQAAHSAGLEVHLWTVNDPEAMRRYLDWGVDGVMSDDPETLARIVQERAGTP